MLSWDNGCGLIRRIHKNVSVYLQMKGIMSTDPVGLPALLERYRAGMF
jgi:hypothetical protein